VLIDAKDKLVVTNYHVVFQSNVYQDHTVVLNNNSILTPFDNPNELRVPFVVYNLTLSRGVQYVFELTSPAFDPLLSIHNFRSQLLAFDKAGGGRMNARLNFVAPYDGKYQLMVATCNGGVGAFTVKGFRLSARIHGASVAPFLLVSFPATENGRVITDANHYLMVNSTNQERHKAKVVAWNEAKDLAILKLNYLPEDVKPMPLARESSQPGHLVHSIGNPGKSGALWVYSSGTVRTAPYQKQWQTSGPGGTMSHDAWIIETQSPINFGDSGGPLVSEDLELVGITQGFNSVSNSISLFVDVREVRSLLRSHGFGWVERK